MLQNYWTTTFRSFRKRLSNTLILFLGLTTAISSFILIFIFVVHEKSFDHFHEKGDRIFRLQQNHYSNKELTNSSASANFGIGGDMAADFPEIEHYTFVLKNKSLLIRGAEVFKEERSAYVSKDFFKVFSFKLLKGNDSLMLSRPYTIALSETLARKIFKDEDPIGKTLNFKGRYDAEVTGVFKDMPENSHMNMHVLLPYETFKKFANPAVLDYPWRWDGMVTYILLHHASERDRVQEKIPDLIERKNGTWLRESDQQLEINLQALYDIHLTSNFSDELSLNGDHQTIIFLSIIAVSILLIAWINYISLATVSSLNRAKEVGIRKALGSFRSQLIGQFMTEACMLNFISVLSALIIVYITLPGFSSLFERSLTTIFFTDPLFYVITVSILILSTLITGIYPAFILSAVQTTEIIKGKLSSGSGGKFLRKAAVFIPFLATVILLIGLFSVYLQLEFLKNRELGFSPYNKLIVRDSEIYDSLYAGRVDVFKKEVLNIPSVKKLTYVSHLPGQFIDYYNDMLRLGADKKAMNEYRYLDVDENFTETLELTILSGKSFTSTGTVKKEVMVNESASRLLGFDSPEDAVEQKVCFNNDTATIKAVIKDYHHEAPKAKVPPTYYRYNPIGGYYFMLSMTNSNASVANEVEKLFSQIFPGQPIDHFFLAEKYGAQYRTDENFSEMISVFLILLLIITCSGLFSLASFTSKFRTREIAVRKVMGASVKQVIGLMLKDYVVIVIVAALVGSPIAYWGVNKWLQSFSIRMEMQWWLFVMPVMAVMLIALLTVIGQTLKAAYANPARTLKNE